MTHKTPPSDHWLALPSLYSIAQVSRKRLQPCQQCANGSAFSTHAVQPNKSNKRANNAEIIVDSFKFNRERTAIAVGKFSSPTAIKVFYHLIDQQA